MIEAAPKIVDKKPETKPATTAVETKPKEDDAPGDIYGEGSPSESGNIEMVFSAQPGTIRLCIKD